MSKSFFRQFQNEDWIATLMGLLLVVTVIVLPGLIPVFPKELNTVGAWLSILGLLVVALLVAALGVRLLGERLKGFLPAFVAIFVLSVLCMLLSGIPAIKRTGFESVFFSVALGLLIRNTVGLPAWLSPAVRSEYYIKIGLVLLGTSVLFGEILEAGFFGILQGIVVVFSVWYFTFWLARKMKVDEEMGVMLSSAVSICGVSAAIATCGAIKGDSKKLSFVVSIVLIVAIPMMYLMPYLAKLMGLSQEVAGAWLGGTIDTTGAVVAAGKFLGETAETQRRIKSSQNVLLGVAAFIISIYWSVRGTSNTELKPTPRVLWDRFPKFVVGFMLASLIFSTCFDMGQAKALGSLAKGLREVMFSVAFVCIGLETDFRYIFKAENRRYIATFLIAQCFNIVVTLIVAWLLFGWLAV